MKFKIENYKLKYTDSFPFELYISIDDSITQIQKSKKGIVFTNNNKLKYTYKEKSKTLTKFATEVSAICVTDDLCIAGDYNGNIKAVDYKKNLLQTNNEHTARINEIRLIEKTKYITCSNDLTTKIFDLAQKNAIQTYKGHEDYVTCAEYTNNAIFTGGMDNLLNIHDVRTNTTTNLHKYDHSVNKLRIMNDNEILVASKSQLFVYDVRNKQNTTSCYATTKNIIDVKVNDNILYCATQDSYIKTYNKNLQKISQYKFDDKLASFDIYNNEICVGCTNGSIYKYNADVKTQKKEVKYETIERYYKDRNTPVKRVKLCGYKQNKIEKLINNNQHWLAFSLLLTEESLQVVFAALSFIKEQRRLKKVLKDRNVDEIYILIDFIINNFHIIEFRTIFLDMLTIIFAMYEKALQTDETLMVNLSYLAELFDFENNFEESAMLLRSIHEAKMLEQK
ncbi:hypothetical protein BDAP_002838 [Binucleata daphniae]